jgi:hypothetical protein
MDAKTASEKAKRKLEGRIARIRRDPGEAETRPFSALFAPPWSLSRDSPDRCYKRRGERATRIKEGSACLGVRYVRLTGPHTWRQRKERGLGEGWLSSSVLQGEEKEENGEVCWGGATVGAPIWDGSADHCTSLPLLPIRCTTAPFGTKRWMEIWAPLPAACSGVRRPYLDMRSAGRCGAYTGEDFALMFETRNSTTTRLASSAKPMKPMLP